MIKASWTPVRDLITAYNATDGSFARVRAEFEGSRGVRILEEYYAPQSANVGALLVRHHSRGWPPKLAYYQLRLHFDPSGCDPRVIGLLHSALSEERKWSLLLAHKPKKVLEEITYTLIVYLLGLRSAKSNGGNLDKAVELGCKDLDKIIGFARQSARRNSLKWYLCGLPLGALAAFAIAVGMWRLGIGAGGGGRVTNDQIARYVAFGAIGAIISVMIRITRRKSLDVDIEQSPAITVMAGGFRPIIGAILGAVLLILIDGGLIPSLAPSTGNPGSLYVGLAFLAGFSERWAQDTIVRSAPGAGKGEPAAEE
jgi:hypothetical protein